jgi:hypothetical protein
VFELLLLWCPEGQRLEKSELADELSVADQFFGQRPIYLVHPDPCRHAPAILL